MKRLTPESEMLKSLLLIIVTKFILHLKKHLLIPRRREQPHIWFIDTSSKRVKGQWKYKTAGIETKIGRQVGTEGDGSAQLGELMALITVLEKVAKYIYTDSYWVYKGCLEWAPFGETKNFVINAVEVKYSLI